MSYVAFWLQACLHWRCAYFQTSSWNDTIFFSRGVKDLSSLVRYDDSCLDAIRHVESIIPVVQPRPNIRSHGVLFCYVIKNTVHSYRITRASAEWYTYLPDIKSCSPAAEKSIAFLESFRVTLKALNTPLACAKCRFNNWGFMIPLPKTCSSFIALSWSIAAANNLPSTSGISGFLEKKSHGLFNGR